MEKLNLTISPEDWGSLVTKYNADSKKVSLASFTDGTFNVDTDITGSLTKREGNVNYNPTLLPAAPKDQFEAIFSDGARHLLVAMNGEIRYSSGDNVFNTVVNGSGFSTVANFEFATTQDRVYGGNGVNAPIVYDRNVNYGGVVYTAPRIRTMGVQAPGTAATAAVAAGGAVPAGTHTYKVTFIYYDFEESNGSPASNNAVTTPGNQTVNLTAVPVGGYGVTARKIYRDNNDQLWLHVGTISNNTATTFSDTVAVGATPTEIPEFNNAPPTFSLIVSWLDRLWLGKVPGDPSTLFYTETSMPDIVRPENQLLCNQEDPITAYIVYFGRLIVFNRRSMGQILGTTSDTFRYSVIPGSIGCVDNRTLQVRVIEGVPILIWLSDRGFYSYDGNAINYISDEIEDLVNFNIQQAIQQKNSNTQSSQTQFQGGTPSNGIDLLSNPGAITTKGYLEGTSVPGTNPRRNLDDQGDWESGSQIANLALRAGDNRLKPVKRFNQAGSFVGVRTGDMDASTASVKLTTFSDFTGVVRTGGQDTVAHPQQTTTKVAQPIADLARAGTITQISVSMHSSLASDPTKNTFRITAWANSGGIPGAVLAQSGNLICTNDTPFSSQTFTFAVSIPLAAGQFCFLGIEQIGTPNFRAILQRYQFVNPFGKYYQYFDAGAWHTTIGDVNQRGMVVGFVFSQTPVAKNGTYTSPTYDTASVTLNAGTLTTVGSFPATFPTKTTSVIVEASNDGLSFAQVFISASRTNLTNAAFSLTGQRYIRVRITMGTTDDRSTDTYTTNTVNFPNPVEWISPTIDCTSDVTIYNSFANTSTPNGGTVTFQIATNTVDSGWGGSGNGPGQFGTFGSHIVRQYVRLKAILTMSGDNVPFVTSMIFTWTIVANLISSIIDTAVAPPAGWDIFLASHTDNGGTVQFQMRSSASAGTIGAATFFTVTPGEFPTAVTPLQFVQWKVIITSADNDVPFVDSVTVQWFIGVVNSIRPASIFTDSRYYVALAELDEVNNNILLELDADGKWRRHEGLNIATFSFFFNRPYFGLSTTGRIRKFLEGLTDAGVAIEFDVRFKASDFSTQYQNNASKVKVVGEVILHGINTGATIQLFYSVDLGQTFIPFVTSEGSVSYVTASDGQNFYVRFRPLWDGSNPISGRTIMYRIHSNDLFTVEIKGLEATAFLRQQAPVVTG